MDISKVVLQWVGEMSTELEDIKSMVKAFEEKITYVEKVLPALEKSIGNDSHKQQEVKMEKKHVVSHFEVDGESSISIYQHRDMSFVEGYMDEVRNGTSRSVENVGVISNVNMDVCEVDARFHKKRRGDDDQNGQNSLEGSIDSRTTKEKLLDVRFKKLDAFLSQRGQAAGQLLNNEDVESTSYTHSETSEVDLLSSMKEDIIDEIPMHCTGQCQFHLHNETTAMQTYIVGPFQVKQKVKYEDKNLVEYVFKEKGNEREIVVATSLGKLQRKHVVTIGPNLLVHSKVVDLVAEMLTEMERRETYNRAKYWFIPTEVSRPKLGAIWELRDPTPWLKWVGKLAYCEKIYLPILLANHWYIAVIHLNNDPGKEMVIVADSLTIPGDLYGLAMIDDMLCALDQVFAKERKEAKGANWLFSNLVVYRDFSAPSVCLNNDCGIYVIKYMQSAYNGDRVCNHGSSDDDRVRVLLQILKSGENSLRAHVTHNANTM